MIARAASFIIIIAAAASGCVGSSEPHEPVPPPHGHVDDDGGDALAGAREPDPWSIDAALPKSGDPARPNVKVEVTVIDVSSRGGLAIRAGVRGTIVRGVVDLRGSVAGGGGRTRARSRTSTFTVVQAGRTSEIALTDDARRLCGPYAGLRVHVFAADARGAELALEPFTAPTTRAGESIEGATRVNVRSGEAVVLGGYSSEGERESRSLGAYRDESGSRDILCVLTVTVIG